jgi:hypothetical protein
VSGEGDRAIERLSHWVITESRRDDRLWPRGRPRAAALGKGAPRQPQKPRRGGGAADGERSRSSRRSHAVACAKPNGLAEQSPGLARRAYPGEREREAWATLKGLRNRPCAPTTCASRCLRQGRPPGQSPHRAVSCRTIAAPPPCCAGRLRLPGRSPPIYWSVEAAPRPWRGAASPRARGWWPPCGKPQAFRTSGRRSRGRRKGRRGDGGKPGQVQQRAVLSTGCRSLWRRATPKTPQPSSPAERLCP